MTTPSQNSDSLSKCRACKLIMVTANNNNKYYEMQETSDGRFTVKYGRVGSRASQRSYPMHLWERKYNEKIRKGYQDQTHLFAENRPKIQFADIEDKTVSDLVKRLINYAQNSVSQNYNVTADQVTKSQVEEAQRILDTLTKRIAPRMRKPAFNQLLLSLYQVIPRKMQDVNDHLVKKATSLEDRQEIQKMLAKEQATLDVMRGQVEINERRKEEPKIQEINLLEAMGLKLERVTDEKTIQLIQDKMQDEADKFSQAFRVTNLRTEKQYQNFLKLSSNLQTELFWHGSRNENWMSILESGLVLRPANAVITGKMFGYGLYFADKFCKSLNYTSLWGSYWASGRSEKGFLALYDVHVGKQLHIKHHDTWCYDLNFDTLQQKDKNCDSVFAIGGADLMNNEYIIYQQQQCTVRYLVEVTNA